MVLKEFESPEESQETIAQAPGRFRVYLKKKARRLPLSLAVAVALALTIKATAFEAVRVTTDALSPRVPVHSRLLINKLSRRADVNDVVVFRSDEGYKVGIVRQVDPQGIGVVIRRNGRPDVAVPSNQIVGKAVFLYSYAL